MDRREAKNINPMVLAYIGDGIYEVIIRKHVVSKGCPHIDAVHKETVKFVKGESQAKIMKALVPYLTEEETTVMKRARNRKILSKPKNIDPVSYKLATAFEALIGFLYMTEQEERLSKLAQIGIRVIEEHIVENNS